MPASPGEGRLAGAAHRAPTPALPLPPTSPLPGPSRGVGGGPSCPPAPPPPREGRTTPLHLCPVLSLAWGCSSSAEPRSCPGPVCGWDDDGAPEPRGGLPGGGVHPRGRPPTQPPLCVRARCSRTRSPALPRPRPFAHPRKRVRAHVCSPTCTRAARTGLPGGAAPPARRPPAARRAGALAVGDRHRTDAAALPVPGGRARRVQEGGPPLRRRGLASVRNPPWLPGARWPLSHLHAEPPLPQPSLHTSPCPHLLPPPTEHWARSPPSLTRGKSPAAPLSARFASEGQLLPVRLLE